jgi:hypothetical protein
MRPAAAAAFLLLSAAPVLGAQSARQLSITRDVVFGHATDPVRGLEFPSALTVGADGSVFIHDHRASTIKVFGATGNYLHSIGRTGAGPGEFEARGGMAQGMGFLGDTLWISLSIRPIVKFYVGREGVRDLELGYDPQRAGFSAGRVAGMLSSGMAVAQEESWATKGDTLAEQLSPIVLLDRSGRVRDTIATPRAGVTRFRVGVTGTQWFRDNMLWSAFPDGSGAVLVERPAPSGAANGVVTVRHVDASGRISRTSTLLYTPIPLRAATFDSVMAAMLPFYPPPVVARATELRASLVVPAFLPTVTYLMTGRDGAIWLRREQYAGEGQRWTLLNRDGTVVGDVRLPASFRPLYGDLNSLYSLETDADDLAWVVRWRVR